MGIYISGLQNLSTGLYFMSVDNNGKDKAVVTVERMLGNRDIRQIVGSFEFIAVPKHGRLADVDEADSRFVEDFGELSDFQCGWNAAMRRVCDEAPTVIDAEE